MKTLQLILLLILAAMIGACASTRVPMPEGDLASAYIWAIEREAQKRATTIYWVNPPSSEDVARKIDKD